MTVPTEIPLQAYLVLAAILFSYFGLQRRAWQQGSDR